MVAELTTATDVSAEPASGREKRKRPVFDCSVCGAKTDAIAGTRRDVIRVCRSCFGRGRDRRPRELNALDGREWAQASKSVEQYPDVRSDKQRLHGASFPESLALQQIGIYTKPGDLVLDPFVGVGTTLDACAKLGRRGIGIDLNAEFAQLAREDLVDAPASASQVVVVADARNLGGHVEDGSVDFVLTSPPYAGLLKNVRGSFAYKWQEHSLINAISNPRPYSDRPEDLGNMSYDAYLEALSTCLRETLRVMRSGAYAVWVIKDFRAMGDGVPFVPLHAHLLQLAEATGFRLWDIRIFDQTKHRPLVCLGYPSKNFYLNIGHSYLVVIRKP